MNDPVKVLFKAAEHIEALRPLYTVLPELSEGERTLCRYILCHPSDVISMSAAELAQAAGVSEATVFRLCRHLKLGGYAALREQIRVAVEKTSASFVAPVHVRNTDDSELSAVRSGAYVGTRVLVDAASMDGHDVLRAAQAIAKAKRLIVCGMGAVTSRIAELAAFGFQHIGVTVMSWVDSQVVNVTQDRFEPTDVVLAISYSGSNASVKRFVELAKAASATTIALTNYPSSPVAQAVDINLATGYREPTVQYLEILPRVSQLMVIQVLINLVYEALRGQERSGSGPEDTTRLLVI